MSKLTLLRTLAIAASALPLLAISAQAQSIDYGSLENLFGEPVTTSATGSPQRSTEVPADMTIISAEDIKRSGAHDLPTLISRVSGVDILQWSGQSADIGVRGYNQPYSPRLLILVNGRQVYLDHYGFTAWSTIPVQLSEIRQIEVVRGPNAALFGFNAVSGVINIITYNPKYDTVNNANLTVSSQNGTGASLVQTIKLAPNVSARLSIGAAKSDEWKNTLNLASSKYRKNPSKASVNLDSVASLTEKTELRFETSYSNSQSTEALPTYDSTQSKYITSSVKLALTSDTDFGLITATAYQNSLTHKLNLIYADAKFNNTITDVSLEDLFKIGSAHTIRLSVEARRNELNTAPITGGKITYDVASAAAMWAWAITDKISTSAAIRSDNLSLKREGSFPAGFPLSNNANWDRNISKLSYNAGVVWRLSDKDTLRLTSASGAQLPSLVELGGLQLALPQPGYTVAVMGNSYLQPSVVDTVQLSYDHSYANSKFGVRLFTQNTEGLKGQISASELFKAPTMTTYPAIGFENVGDSEMTGFEITASGHFGKGFHWNADVTQLDIEDKAYAGHNLVVRKTSIERLTPKTRANLGLGWQNDKWALDTYIYQSGSFISYSLSDNAPMEIEAFSSVSANIGYNITETMNVSVSGQNLLKAKTQTPGLKVPQTIFISLSKNW